MFPIKCTLQAGINTQTFHMRQRHAPTLDVSIKWTKSRNNIHILVVNTEDIHTGFPLFHSDKIP